jgi:hypothetical protein
MSLRENSEFIEWYHRDSSNIFLVLEENHFSIQTVNKFKSILLYKEKLFNALNKKMYLITKWNLHFHFLI